MLIWAPHELTELTVESPSDSDVLTDLCADDYEKGAIVEDPIGPYCTEHLPPLEKSIKGSDVPVDGPNKDAKDP